MQPADIPSEYIKPHYSTKLIKSIYNYFLKYYSEEMINKIFADLHVSKDYFLNDDNWHSNELNKKICEKIILETGDNKILFNIGKELLQPQNINFLEFQILKILPPFLLFKNLPKEASKINNVFKLETVRAKPGYFEYQIQLPENIDVHPGVLNNTEGCLHAFKEFCQLENFTLEVLKKDNIVSYKLRYTAYRYWFVKIIPTATYLMLTWVMANKIFNKSIQDLNFYAMLAFIASMVLGMSTFLLLKKIVTIIKMNDLYYINTKEKNEKIYEKSLQLENKLNQEQYMKNIMLTLIKSQKVDDIIDDSLNSICKNIRYEKAMVMLASDKNKSLKTVSVRGISESSLLKNLQLTYPATDQESMFFSNILDKKKTVLIENIDEFRIKIKKENQTIIDVLGVNSLIVSPIGDMDRSFGLLVIGSTNADKLNENDRKFIESISSLMSLFFQKYYTLETESTLRSIFEKYVPKTVLNEIHNMTDKNSWRIPPQSKHVASMFIDLKGFTSVSENLNPEHVFKMLDLYFESIASIVGARGGIIDNIIADEMVLFFPEAPGQKHCSDCLITAIEICAEWHNIQQKVALNDLPLLSVGIGIHSGVASIGTVGSDIRSNYTCLGDTINTTSRIQKISRAHFPETDSAVIIASKTLFDEAKVPITNKPIENVHIRGKVDTINLVQIKQSDAMSFSAFLKNIKDAS